MEESKIINFLGTKCEVIKRQYENGRAAIQLIDLEDGIPYAVATINVPEVNLKENETIIKDYSENEGMLLALEKAGIVKATGQSVRSGFITAPIVEVLI